jgi:hypothetical protein
MQPLAVPGTYRRVRSVHGVIRIWKPTRYEQSSAGVVIYVHGYQRSADEVWTDQHMAEQFEQSGQNALFIVPEAPRSRNDAVQWASLGELWTALETARIRVPRGPVIAIGHSGAYRSIAQWVDDPSLREIILLDAVYGDPAPFQRFLEATQDERKLLIVAAETAPASEAFARDFAYAIRRDSLPDSYEAFTRGERRAKLLLIRSQYSHSEMIDNGQVVPLVLRLSPLRWLGAGPEKPSPESQAATTRL